MKGNKIMKISLSFNELQRSNWVIPDRLQGTANGADFKSINRGFIPRALLGDLDGPLKSSA